MCISSVVGINNVIVTFLLVVALYVDVSATVIDSVCTLGMQIDFQPTSAWQLLRMFFFFFFASLFFPHSIFLPSFLVCEAASQVYVCVDSQPIYLE